MSEAEIHLEENELINEDEMIAQKIEQTEESEDKINQSQDKLNEGTEQKEHQQQQQQTETVKEEKKQRRSSKAILTDAVANISKINKGLYQVIQFAGEKIGAVSKTELPLEYTLLEGRVDKLKSVYENLIRLSAYQIHQSISLKFSVYDAAQNVAEKIAPETERVREVDLHQLKGTGVAVSEYLKAGKMVGQETYLGSALIKTGELHDKLSKNRYQMYQEINEKTIRKLGKTLDTKFREISYLRRVVHNSRLKLDSIKSIARSATPSRVEELTEEITEAQKEFQKSVNEAVKAMRDILKSNDAAECLANYHSAMLTYFKHASEKMAELLPEIDSLKVAEEEQSKKLMAEMKEEELKEKLEKEERDRIKAERKKEQEREREERQKQREKEKENEQEFERELEKEQQESINDDKQKEEEEEEEEEEEVKDVVVQDGEEQEVN